MLSRRNRQILLLAVPSIVQNITVPLLGLCDVAIAGHIGDAVTIGAIAVGSMIFNVMYWLCGFLRMGTSGITAQALGGRRIGDAVCALRQGLMVALSIGIAIVALQLPLRSLSLWLMQPTADVASLCLPYYNICVWGAPAVLGLYALTGWFIGMQNTRTPMVIAIVQNVVNIVASLLFVVVGGMGIEGIATGTLVAQWTGFALALVLLSLFYGKRIRAVWKPNDPSAHTQRPVGLRRFLSINRDIFLRTLCLVAVNLYFTSAGARQGALLLAVNTLLMQLFTLFSYFMDGFAYAGEALAGRYYGARNHDALNDTVRCLMRWGWGVTTLFTLLYWLGGAPFLRLLTDDATVVAAAREYLPWALLIPLSGMAAFVWDGVFIGLTYTRGMLYSCLLATVAFFGLWACLQSIWANHALWFALIVYLALRGIVQGLLYRKNYR
jgi:MATE family multidrug resistance protein